MMPSIARVARTRSKPVLLLSVMCQLDWYVLSSEGRTTVSFGWVSAAVDFQTTYLPLTASIGSRYS